MRYLNIILIVTLGGLLAYGFNKFKTLISSFFGGNDEKKELIEILTSTEDEPSKGQHQDIFYDDLIKNIDNEFEIDSHPTENKDKIVDVITELTPLELKYLVDRFGVKNKKVGFGFFSKELELSLPKILALEYSSGLLGGTSGTDRHRIDLTKSFSRIGVILNF